MISKNISFQYLLVSLLFILIATGCGGEKMEEKNNADNEDAGIPVVAEKVSEQPFVKSLSFFTQLRGRREAIEGAAIGGRIEKINFGVGKRVKKDDIVIEFPEDAPASMYLQAKTAYENSKKNFERAEALLEAGETSQANYDGLKTQYLVNKSNYETQHQMLFIKAPFDGIITSVMVNEGDNVKGKDPLFSVADLSKMTCKIWASSDEIKQIRKGMEAVINTDGKQIIGKVTEISLTADPARRSFYAEIEFDNPDNLLKSGVTESVDIDVYENMNAIVVPRNLVRTDQGGSFVMVVKNSQTEKRYITIGEEMNMQMEVVDGLKAGDNLIVKGGAKIADNVKVNVIQ